jgi:hypothetical protein
LELLVENPGDDCDEDIVVAPSTLTLKSVEERQDIILVYNFMYL